MDFSITAYGAKPDTGIIQTEYIQKAIDACFAAGGGTVTVPAGEYIITGIRLKSNISLKLLSGAHLKGSDKPEDYINFGIPSTIAYAENEEWIERWHLPKGRYFNALITCADAHDVMITGEEGSIIDGSDCCDPEGEEGFRGPMGIRFTRCQNINLNGYTVVRSANWAHQIDGCDGIRIDGVKVYEGHDGIDIHHCENIHINNCVIKTGDDCLAGYDCENLLVENCTLNTSCNFFRIGAKNMTVRNCRFEGEGIYPHRVSGRHNSLCGFEYYSHAADPVQRISGAWHIENCSFMNMDRLIHYDFPTDWCLQMTAPLTDAEFVNCSFSGIRQDGVFKSKNGAVPVLKFVSCTVNDCVEIMKDKEA